MKPQPVIVTTICSMCAQPWEAHGDKPTTEDCIRLLRAELARRPYITINPTPVLPYRVYPDWNTITGDSTTPVTTSIYAINTTSQMTPTLSKNTCSPVAA